MLRRIALFTASCFVVLAAQAQLTITGTVLDEQDQPLSGAHVLIDGTLLGVSADYKGEFSLGNLKPGNYILIVSFVGYSKLVYPVELKESVTLVLKPVPERIMAGEVTVRATRANPNDPVAHTNLLKEEFRRTNRTHDIPYLLALTPSLVTTSDGGAGVGYTGLRIRGTDPTRINVTINGIPFNDSESHEVYWVDIPDIISSTESVQIQRGVGTSTQGAGAFGANINFQTTALNPDPFAEISSAAGSFNTWKTSVSAGTGLLGDHISLDARLSRIHSDGYIDRAFTDLKSVYLSGGYFAKRSIVKATLFSGNELTYQAWGGVPSELLEDNRTYNPYSYENEVDNYQQDHLQVSWSQYLSPETDFTIALHYTGGKGYYEQFRENEKLSDYLLAPLITGNDTLEEVSLVRRKWLDNRFLGTVYSLNHHPGRFSFTAGGGLNHYSGDHFGRVIWASLAPTAHPDHQYYFNQGIKSEWNQFVKINYALYKRLSIYGDIQYRYINYRISGIDDNLRDIGQDHRYHFINPKTGITYDLGKGRKVFLSYAIARREPKRSNFTDARPGQEVRPEKLRDIEAGYQYGSRVFSASINLYWMDYTDQLVLTGEINDVGAPIMVNVPESYRAGMESVIKLNPARFLQWDMNLTLSRNRIIDFTEFIDNWDTDGQQANKLGTTDLSFSPGIIAGNRLTWLINKCLRVSLDSKYAGRQFIDNTSDPERSIDPYLVNNLLISWNFRTKFIPEGSLFFQVNNILNEKYETNAWVYSYLFEGQRHKMDGYFPQAGINFLAGFSVNLADF